MVRSTDDVAASRVAAGSRAPAGSLLADTAYASTTEAADPYCLRPGEAAKLLTGHPWRRFVVLGDSVASGVGDPVEGYTAMPWCDRIAAELHATAPDFAYFNIGARDLLAGQIRELQLGQAIAFGGDLALVSAGGNDALSRSYRADKVEVEITAIIGALRSAGYDVITVGLFDASHAPAIPDVLRRSVSTRLRDLSARTATIAEQYAAIHVNMIGHPVEPDAGMYSADGIHGNFRSHAICAAEAIRALGAHLATKPDLYAS